VIFLPFVLAYQTWTYYVFRRRISRREFLPPPPRPAGHARSVRGSPRRRRRQPARKRACSAAALPAVSGVSYTYGIGESRPGRLARLPCHPVTSGHLTGTCEAFCPIIAIFSKSSVARKITAGYTEPVLLRTPAVAEHSTRSVSRPEVNLATAETKLAYRRASAPHAARGTRPGTDATMIPPLVSPATALRRSCGDSQSGS
jgi:hypothetical protein